MARMPGLTAGRTHLTPFFLGEGGSFEAGDDGIVPSTPTLPVPRRSDGFAEAVSSPQVSRQFVFSGGSDGLAQLEEQRGMDDTNFDLSQTLTYRSVPTTPVPTISVTEASPPSAEEQDTESAGANPQLEVTASESRLVSTSQSQSAMGQEAAQESQQVEDISQGGEGSGETAAADDGGSDNNSSGAMSRRKIQPIVWSEPGPSAIPPLMGPGQSQQVAPQPTMPGRKLRQQRAVRGQIGMYRGRGTPRSVAPQPAGMAQPRAPLYPQQPIQTVQTPRGRGTRGARGSRGNRAFRQRRPQPF
ncbi:hypothetical protein NP493_203g01015 [Ridgeia piscesae]|uniref:Uncharacterized protein n=1 Tax=Ridgeia piscesae TaxID=27915 RepID=A0AAD9P1E2_RIDPI|nr:hypothetical protein NP493_203g01015 [Ridgeia piscesae]